MKDKDKIGFKDFLHLVFGMIALLIFGLYSVVGIMTGMAVGCRIDNSNEYRGIAVLVGCFALFFIGNWVGKYKKPSK